MEQWWVGPRARGGTIKPRAFLYLIFGKSVLKCEGCTAFLEIGLMVPLDFEILRLLVGFSI